MRSGLQRLKESSASHIVARLLNSGRKGVRSTRIRTCFFLLSAVAKGEARGNLAVVCSWLFKMSETISNSQCTGYVPAHI
jgi:hypothetical protein